MRVGKFVEHFKAAAVASDAKSMDPVLRFTAIGRQLGYAGYMVFDNATVVCIALPSLRARVVLWLVGGREGKRRARHRHRRP
jgi:hypothetical protein